MRAQPFHWASVALSVVAGVFLVLEFLGRTGPLKGMFWVLLGGLLGGSGVVGGVGDKLDRRLKGMSELPPNLVIGAGVLMLVLSIVLFAMR